MLTVETEKGGAVAIEYIICVCTFIISEPTLNIRSFFIAGEEQVISVISSVMGFVSKITAYILSGLIVGEVNVENTVSNCYNF